jgi:hypothetical protein
MIFAILERSYDFSRENYSRAGDFARTSGSSGYSHP